MKNLPSLILTKRTYSGGYSKSGEMGNLYNPFKNLIDENGSISEFRTTNLDINFPVNIEIQPSFDGSVNLILNDDLTSPKLINSRFSVEENNTYTITDHKGNKDTNLYEDNNLTLDTKLYKSISKIAKLEFKGFSSAGKMKCGNYHFYFKLTDNDGNETDFISESGLVTCHIGNINDPYSIRMGMNNEDSKKCVNFRLYNLDTAYDFVKVYYTRTTSDDTQQDILTAHLIDNKFIINKTECDITITGYEDIEDISLNDINVSYEIVKSVKGQAQCQNMLFLANIDKINIPYEELLDLSLRFIPKLNQNSEIGNVTYDYKDYSQSNAYEYYNVNNIYNNLGYWPEEYYRLGIVYILNDYTLSPVFNVRGLYFEDGATTSEYTDIPTLLSGGRQYIAFNEDGYIENGKLFENAKGVIKLGKNNVITSDIIKPISIGFDIDDDTITELKKYTKGFFIVRQERIPTIYSQGMIIGKTKDDYGNIPVLKNDTNYFTESFLRYSGSKNILERNQITITANVENKASIIPEAEIRYELFNQLFTSTNYKLTLSGNQASNKYVSQVLPINNYNLDINSSVYNSTVYDSLLTLVKKELKLTTNGTDYFSSKAGEAEQAWETIDVSKSWKTVDPAITSPYAGINTVLKNSDTLVRGAFGTYVGLSNSSLDFGTIFNVRPSDFEESDSYKLLMFKLRMDSSEPYFAINDRLEWNDYNITKGLSIFGGDCYICNFTHRINYNFIDPDLPTNNNIIDINTWNKNYAVYQDTIVDSKALNRQLITYKQKTGTVSGDNTLYPVGKILEPNDPNYASAGSGLLDIFDKSDWKMYGCDKINRADVNAVPLGHWVTFKVMSNINLSMRDLDSSYPEEEAIHGYKRSFYPYGNKMDIKSKLSESSVINGASNVTLSKRPNFIIPDVPIIKDKFDNRILYSDIHVTDAFKNGYRVFQSGHYQDYTKIYGSITDLKEWYGNLFVTLEHGCMMIPVNERAVAAEGAGGMAYINTSNVLPQNPKIISNLFGSTWQESVVKTKTGIYGIDTVAKKIWMSDGQSFVVISDLKVQKFLNDNVDLLESNKLPILGLRNVKTHYNKTKGDIIFTFYNGTKEWSLCYNENLKKFITFYSWIPSYSININNVFFSLDKEDSKNIKNGASTTSVKLWKHGQSGLYDEQGIIKPTTWYDQTEPFEFEFVVAEIPTVQKIFNNLKLISNKAEPSSFEFEVVGEGYEWYDYKDIIVWISKNQNYLSTQLGTDVETDTLKRAYKYVLKNNQATLVGLNLNFPKLFNKEDSYIMPKLPFIPRVRAVNPTYVGDVEQNIGLNNYELNTVNTTLVNDELLNEDKVHTEQLGNDIKKYGRSRGNMMYLEDSWEVEIKPINFKYAYISNGILSFTTGKEMRIRDKYLKIKVKYSGNDLAIIQGIKTLFTISYA